MDGNVQDLGHEPQPLTGAEIHEYRCDGEPGVADTRGEFSMQLLRPEEPIVTVDQPGYIPVFMGLHEVDLPRGIELPLYDRAGEIEFSIEDFGVPYDPEFGAVLFHFYTEEDTAASELTAGIRAWIDLEANSVWALDTTDEHVEGDVVPEGSSSAEIWYHQVEPGTATLSIEVPSGATCTGPEVLPVRADTYTHANYYCFE